MNEMEKATNLYALGKSYRRVMRGKRGKPAAIKFSVNALEGLCRLKWMLESRRFVMSDYTEFSVERPVHRDVKSCSFKDKIVLGSLSKNVLWPMLEPHLIEDNYASRSGKGTHYALNRLEKNLRAYYINHGSSGYVLRIDARKYFYNLSHDIIMEDLRKYGFEDWTLWLCSEILRSSHHTLKRGYLSCGINGRPKIVFCDMEGFPLMEVGSPIGNETSQVFAVEYQNPVDHEIKDQRGVKYYGRYMDDSYIIHHDKEYLQNLLEDIRTLYADIGLELNQKTEITPLKNGICFLGMHLYLTDSGKVIRRVRPRNIRYARVHIRENARMVADGEMTKESYWHRFGAMDNHISYADAKSIRRKLRRYAEEALQNAIARKQRQLGKVGSDIDDLS